MGGEAASKMTVGKEKGKKQQHGQGPNETLRRLATGRDDGRRTVYTGMRPSGKLDKKASKILREGKGD